MPEKNSDGARPAGSQQAEALRYFKDFAADWERKALSASDERVNIIQQRNQYVLRVIDGRRETQRMLDIGCGTGELVVEAARRGVAAVGVDFAGEMIAIAQEKAQAEGVERADFVCSSIFEVELGEAAYDVISANGFIEYISPDELGALLSLAHRALRRGGSLVLGSRNRLFNLFSLNSYTAAELEGEEAVRLLAEAVAVASDAPLAALLEIEAAALQRPQTRHANTGIDVSTRYQFTPVQLMQLLGRAGFASLELFPIHIHGVPPAFKAKQPAVHTAVSNLLQQYGGDYRCLIPLASSFMIHAVRSQP